jgi:flagellar hook-associated protein 3 FlgL
MRISTAMRTDAAMANLQRLESEHQEAAQQASTGARLVTPSQDPVAAARAVRVQAAIDRTKALAETVRDVRGDLELSESALASGTDILARIRELVMSASSESMNDQDRKLLATEVATLKGELVSLANTKGSQGFVFGGTQTAAAPFSALGAFTGNDLARDVEISPGSTLRANPSGASAFTVAGGVDVFKTLDTLEAALALGDADQVAATLGAVDASHRQIVDERARIGMTLARLDVTEAVHAETVTSLAGSLHGLVDVDLPAAYSRLVTLQQRIEQAIGVTRQILAMSSPQV